jgi:SAM-dependent methyltransferase
MSMLRDGIHYDLLNQNLKDDINFYLEMARKIGGPVLELCCGTGRITIPTAETGIDITGLEIDPSMLGHARLKSGHLGAKVRWVEGDATRFDMGSLFSLITTPFNSVQLFGSVQKLSSYFQCVRDHLTLDGMLVFDVYNPNPNYLASVLKARRSAGSYVHPETGETVTVEWDNVYDDAAQVNCVTFYYSTERKGEFAKDYLESRCFYPLELDYLVESHGFKIVQKLGDFSGKRFSNGDPKQIVVCKASGSF